MKTLLYLVSVGYTTFGESDRRLSSRTERRSTGFDSDRSKFEKAVSSEKDDADRNKRCLDGTCGGDENSGVSPGEGGVYEPSVGPGGGDGGGITCTCTCDGLPIDADAGSGLGVGNGREPCLFCWAIHPVNNRPRPPRPPISPYPGFIAVPG